MPDLYSYPVDFRTWWLGQKVYKAYQAELIPPELCTTLMKAAYSGWTARENLSSESLKEEPVKNTFLQVRTIISEKMRCIEENITLQTSFVEDLNADSLDQVELIMAFEDFYDIEIPDQAVEGVKTVSDVVELLSKSLTRV
jgi:acyl carrier protein